MNLSELEQQYGLPPGLLSAVMGQESGGKADAVSPKGALGAFQFMPATAKQYGVNPLDPESSAQGAAKYYRDLLAQNNGDLPKALASYNWGPGNVAKYGIDKAPPETQNYVKKVTAKMADPMDWLEANAPKRQGAPQAEAAPASDPAMSWLEANAPKAPNAPDKGAVQRAMLLRQISGGMPFFGSFTGDVAQGLSQTAHAADQMASRLIGSPAEVKTADSSSDQAQALYDKMLQPDATAPVAAPIARGVGQTLATAPAMGMKAAVTLPKVLAQSGVMGGLTSLLEPIKNAGADFWDKKSEQGQEGALLGMATGGAFNAAGRVLSPNSSEAVQTLLKEGVTPTLGQTLGGAWKTLEEKATSIPLVGDAIRSAQTKGLDEFNRAIYNRILAPIGEKYKGPAGQDGLAHVAGKLSDAYENVLAKIPMVAVDHSFGMKTMQLQKMAKSMPPDQAQQFNNIVQNEVWNRMTPAATLSGDAMKEMESKLGQIARGYRGSTDFDQRQLGDAVAQVQANLRDMVARQYPEAAKTLQAVNKGYVQLTQLENAANTTKVARNEGVVTPSDYLRGVKRSDNSQRDRVFAQGGAMNQDLAQAGDKVLSNKYPDSGSIGRLMVGAGAANAGALLNPGLLAGAGAATLPYLPGGRQVMAALLARRPDIAKMLGEPIKQAAPYLGVAAPAGLLGLLQ